jgi:hypothetical protein
VEYFGAFVLGGFVGMIVSLFRPRRTKSPPRTTMIAIRQASSSAGAAYRDPATETACTLEELRADLAAPGLTATIDGSMLELVRGKERIRIVAQDPRRVTLASLDLEQTGCDALYFEAALALVPRFGPLRLAVAMFGIYSIDATRTVAALVDERSERIGAIASAIVNDMQNKQQVYGRP